MLGALYEPGIVAGASSSALVYGFEHLTAGQDLCDTA
jgi:hypothetical protein